MEDNLKKNCKECELKKDLNNHVIDNHYIIDGYAYAFKKELQNNRISLRCQFRTKCAALATVNKNDLLQKLEGKIESFSYSLNKEHKWNGISEIKKNAVEVNTEVNFIFIQCYDYLHLYHIKYKKELEFKDIEELAKDPENNIDKITKSILSLYRDSYVRNLEIKSEVEENENNNGESKNLIDEKNITSEEDDVLEITEKTDKINLSDEKEIEPYDPSWKTIKKKKKIL